ncbi:ABC transporter permease [Actinomadura parmotrematis]|uniref:ABC transporter permease n=1 Tax=Actinomadura parmotrematis TaxID=2864039 RepID=A0ABS7FQ28_9ACTN|nr:ABC transporter permease [Actinomadura parmotrematis]MBW8482482.1 ABC transporter permease [Actinomadura parmotrematis]
MSVEHSPRLRAGGRAVPQRRSARGAGRPRLTRTGRAVRGLAGVLVLAAALEILARSGAVAADSLSPTSDIVVRAGELLGDGAFWSASLVPTLKAWGLGLVIAVAVAVPLGLLLGSVPYVNTATRAVVEFLRPIPSVALIPLVSLILGTGLEMKVVLIVYAAVWPVMFNTLYGLGDADPVAKDTLRSFGFGPLAVLWRVTLPAALPFIYTGVRLATSIALILAVGAEILAGFGDGLGIFIGQAMGTLDGTRDVMTGTLLAGCLGLLANSLLAFGERRLFRWHVREERS